MRSGSIVLVGAGNMGGAILRRWLAAFHVTPRDSLREALESECEKRGASLRFDSSFRGYAVQAIVEMPAVDEILLQ